AETPEVTPASEPKTGQATNDDKRQAASDAAAKVGDAGKTAPAGQPTSDNHADDAKIPEPLSKSWEKQASRAVTNQSPLPPPPQAEPKLPSLKEETAKIMRDYRVMTGQATDEERW